MNKKAPLIIAVFGFIGIILLATISAAPGEPAEVAGIRQILVTGQSLAYGGPGRPMPVIDYAEPCEDAYKWNRTSKTYGPLVQKNHVGSRTGLTSPGVSLGHSLCDRTQAPWTVNTEARGATGYSGLKKGTAEYNKQIANIQPDVETSALVIIHGENDATRAGYSANIKQWRKDYESDIQKIQKNNKTLPGLITQVAKSDKFVQVHEEQLKAHLEDSDITLIGPAHQHEKSGDQLHLTNKGYYYNGEIVARILDHVVVQGKKWEPMRPTKITSNGNKVNITFHTPVKPLKIDDASKIKVVGTIVQSVKAISGDTIELTLNKEPRHNAIVEYLNGNIRDSETDKSSLDGTPIPNYAIIFKKNIGYDQSAFADDPQPEPADLQEVETWELTPPAKKQEDMDASGGGYVEF